MSSGAASNRRELSLPAGARRFLAYAAALMLATALPLHALGVDVLWSSVRSSLRYFGIVLTLFVAFRIWKRAPLVELLLEVTLWSLLIGDIVNMPLALCVRLPVPFSDLAAKSLDSRLGIHVGAVRELALRHPRLNAFSDLIYDSLWRVNTLTVYVPVIARRPRWASEMFVALVLAFGATFACMLCAQAIGPWVVNGVHPTASQHGIEQVMLQVKHAPTFRLDMSDIAGFVSFPSWHVLLAMFSAFTIGRVRGLKIPCMLWAALVALSTLTTGWHYGVDVISGLVVGCLAMLGSRALHRYWERAAAARGAAIPVENGLKSVLS